MTEFGQLFGGTLNRLYQFPKPTIAAVSGHAIAGGCLLACACDVRYAVQGNFNMAMNETLIKMTIPSWANNIIENVVPKPYASAMLSMAEFMSFEQAEALGIISQRFEDHASLLAAALEKAETFKQFSMPNFTANKLSVRTF